MNFNKNLINHIANLGSMQISMDSEPNGDPNIVNGSNYGSGDDFFKVSMEVLMEEDKEFAIRCSVEGTKESKHNDFPLHSSAKTIKDWFEGSIEDLGFIRSWVKVQSIDEVE